GTTEFEDLIANLKISQGNQQTPPPPAVPEEPSNQPDGPLSPQSFAMGYGPPPLWGMPLPPHHHPNQPFYGAPGTFPGAVRPQQATSVPIGSHNQFIPLQEAREFYSAAQTVAKNQSQRAQSQLSAQSQPQNESQSNKSHQSHTHEANNDPASSSPSLADNFSTKTAVSHTPPRQSAPTAGHTPGSASKRKHRKLAVNFEATKVSE
ncbi:hypothetical protein XENOCAPTIV_023792, partial [Xenoophorus captivus]